MKNKEEVLKRLMDFRNSHDIWDSEEYTQQTMCDELDEIMLFIEKNL